MREERRETPYGIAVDYFSTEGKPLATRYVAIRDTARRTPLWVAYLALPLATFLLGYAVAVLPAG